MKLFYSKGACSLVVRIVLNELGIAFQEEAVDLRTKKTESGSNFWAINPKGAVPALMLDNGEVLSENQVILQYLADNQTHQTLLPALGNFSRYRTLEWLNFISTELHKTLGFCFAPTIPEAVKNDVLLARAKERFAFINSHLEHHGYLVGQEFSLPDAYLFVMVRWARFLNVDLRTLSHLHAYIDRLQQRPSIKHSLKQEGL